MPVPARNEASEGWLLEHRVIAGFIILGIGVLVLLGSYVASVFNALTIMGILIMALGLYFIIRYWNQRKSDKGIN
jgi:hypothetical protein